MIAEGVSQTLFFYPFLCSVVAFVDVNDDLVTESRVFNDTVDTYFQIWQIVPGRDKDGKHCRKDNRFLKITFACAAIQNPWFFAFYF